MTLMNFPVSWNHAAMVRQLSFYHKDSFDRLIIESSQGHPGASACRIEDLCRENGPLQPDYDFEGVFTFTYKRESYPGPEVPFEAQFRID